MIKVYNARDEFEANMLLAVLEQEDIACYARESGVGEWMKITQGFSVYGKDIYVQEQNADHAKNLIREALQTNEQAPFADDNIRIPWYQNRVFLVRVLLAFMFVGVILSVILSWF